MDLFERGWEQPERYHGIDARIWGVFAKIGKKKELGRNCTFDVQQIVANYLPADVKQRAKFFSKDLLASNNFYNRKTGSSIAPQNPFTGEQKPVLQVLVIQDEDKNTGNKSLQMLLVDMEDSKYFHRKLQDDYESATEAAGTETRTRKIALYDVQNRLISVQGKNQFEAGELDTEVFHHLLVQVKVLNGDLDYHDGKDGTFNELGYLHVCTQTLGEKTMNALVRDHVFHREPKKKQLYQKFPIGKALKV